MKKIYLFALLVITGLGCSKEGIPDSLEEILKHAGYSDLASGGGGGSGSGGSGGAIKYQGAYAADVKNLLGKVSGWRTPSSANSNDGVPPNVPINANCQRDAYVAGAVNYAWAAESYYRLGNTTQAASMAKLMNDNLVLARNLCSGVVTPGTGGGSCQTFGIYPC